MAAIDLIVLGMLRREALSAYEIQKQVEYRNISKWVKISTPSIYKKVLQLEGKGLIAGSVVREGKMPEKAVYRLTEAGEREFERLMLEIARAPVRILLDFNAVIVNLDGASPGLQGACLEGIEGNLKALNACLEENIQKKENLPGIPEAGKAVLRQQYALAQALEEWISTLRVCARDAEGEAR